MWITSTLTWSIQVEETCRKARRQIGFLYRRFYKYASNPTFLRLYLSYVRPHLEYAAAVWDPHQRGLINTLERIQKFALKASTIGTGMLIMTLQLEPATYLLWKSGVSSLSKLSILYQIINGQLVISGAPIERRIQQRSLRNSTSTLLQRPVTHTNAHLPLLCRWVNL